MKVDVKDVMNNKIKTIKSGEDLNSIKDIKNLIDYLIVDNEKGQVNEIYYFNSGKEFPLTLSAVEYVCFDALLDIDEWNHNIIIVTDDKKNKIGIITSREVIRYLNKKYGSLMESYNSIKTDLDAFMACSDDMVCISDGSGIKVRLSSSCKKIYGLKPEELVGKSVNELEKSGMYFPSATRIVIEEKKPVTLTQKTKSGKRLLVTAMPVFDDNNNIVRVVSISKDITNEEKLKNDLNKTRDLLQRYEHELAALRIEQTRDSNLVYKSKAMEKVLELVKKVAPVDSTLLIYGETGVGKEVICKYIHNISNRSGGPFVKINCGSIPENLLEAELFGYENGAFTGARSEGKPGLFEIADKGTLLLDEIGELPLLLQVKLLRVLQEREFMRVGGIKPRKVDVRIIAATNKDLKKLVDEGKFREDLYYRLNVIPITIPPLRERLEDIPVLTYYFLDMYNKKYSFSKQITNEVIETFIKYDWPGNVRELENVVERAVIISESNFIRNNDLPSELTNIKENSNSLDGIYVSKLMPLKKASALLEYQLIKKALDENGSTYKAAKVLDVDQSTIVRKLQKYRDIVN
ncbi:PAS modulated sigma54 specific transcriptional regulator, Fis family [Thermoanaerobacterium thermosaccharolyticum]|uniref:PAS modulated sigma54 specific transcriptional regulator, Fis family n=1 Tax=Thermoanaerobacterium thermosaccharolyticum TaxID=1517 RepID=A0A223I060_THETR|nr:sigma 54-interacting transcriptional regulator [Thermoanaerobacterium thermosaccharolyticum]AST57915.1 PAS modulated sigma54 specific transcriptional regulator, Fis family [Thermoanaerobacterium thermosaccharolyticum]